jgi:predicted acylesterase/phospholipase RssA
MALPIIFPSEKILFWDKKNLNLISFSGASTKIVGEFSSSHHLITQVGYKPDIITGISAGALLCVPVALGKWGQLKKLMDTFNLKTIFDKMPVRSNGKVHPTAVWRAVKGREGLGTMGNLEKTLRQLISPKEFNHYQKNDKYAVCIIMAYDIIKCRRVYVNLKECTYNDYIKFTLASASIPVMAEPIEIHGMQLVDGGLVDHNIGAWAMDNLSVKNSISIYSRPENGAKIEEKKADNLLDVVERVLAVTLRETSANDEWQERAIAEREKMNWKAIYLPSTLKSTYDTDRRRLMQLQNESLKLTIQMQNERAFDGMV